MPCSTDCIRWRGLAGGASRIGKGPAGGSHLHHEEQVLVAVPEESQDDTFEVPATQTKHISEVLLTDAATQTKPSNGEFGVFFSDPILVITRYCSWTLPFEHPN